MPIIPSYERKYTIPGEGPNVQQDIGSAGIVGNAMAAFGAQATEVIAKRGMELQKQKQDAILIEKGAQISDEVLNFELAFEKENKGAAAGGSVGRASSFTSSLFGRYKTGDAVIDNKLQEHISALDYRLKTKLASHEATELKNYSTAVRALDYETSRKLAQNGQVDLALINYKKTLDVQRANNTLSEEEYKIEQIKSTSGLLEAHITALISDDPVSAQKVFEVVKKDLLADTVKSLEASIKPAVIRRKGTDIGTAIFKEDTTGSLERMHDKLMELKLDVETERIADGAITALFNKRKVDKDTNEKAVFGKAAEYLTNTSRQGGGRLNTLSDIPNDVWVEMTKVDPIKASQVVNHIMSEQRQQARLNAAESRDEQRLIKAEIDAEKAAKRETQTANANLLFADPKLLDDTHLPSLLATGSISPQQFQTLTAVQQRNDPLKSNEAARAIKALDNAKTKKLFSRDNDAENIKKWSEYTDLLHRFILNNPNEDPNEFVNDKILKPVKIDFVRWAIDVASIGTPGTDAAKSAKMAELTKLAGPAIKRRVSPALMDEKPPASEHKGRVITDTATGKRLQSNGKEWVEVK